MTHEQTRLPFADAATDWTPANWRGTWIWSAQPTGGHHDYVYFRREFSLQSAPELVLLRIAAERDAALWVNGTLIAHGPPISDPRFKRYETHDITSHLQAGNNCIAVRVYHDMGRGKFTAHADARGLLCQVEAGDEIIVATDENWRTWVCRAYLKPAILMGDSMWPEFFDANQDTPGWQHAGFDDRAWTSAFRLIQPVHSLWHAQQPQARFYPWVNLIPCETRPLKRIRHRPHAVLTVGEVLQQREARSDDVAVRMSLEIIQPLSKASVVNVENLVSGQGTVTICNSSLTESYDTFDGLRNATIVLDFGRLINARFGFRLKTDAAVVDVGYAYRLEAGRVVPYVSNRTAIADMYIARPGEQSWETADWRHFRYVQLTFRNVPTELILESVWAEEIQNHFESCGQFACSDSRLNRLFDLSRQTTLLNVVDRTMDNPSRERKQYLGDCSAIVPAITSCFGDSALLRRYFLNAREGQHATGLYRYSYPGHDDDRASLFDHALSLPLRLWEHTQLFADRELVNAMWPSMVNLMELAASCLDDDALMNLPPYNIWFDWGHMDRRGFFLPLQVMTAQAMRCVAQLAQFINQSPEPWSQIAQRMNSQISRWYDPERNVFVDAIVDGQRQSHVSEHANSLLAMWQMVPASTMQPFFEQWAQNPMAFGQTSPAWLYLPAAFIRAGRPELAIRWMHHRLAQLESQGIETWPETWCLYGERTLGTWRCRNSRAVAQGAGLGITTALLTDLCGIQPAEPGFSVVRLVPQVGPLTSLEGTMPGPDGDYSTKLNKIENTWQIEVCLPGPRPLIFDAALAPDVRQIHVNSQPLKATSEFELPNGTIVGRFTWNAERVSVMRLTCHD